MCTVRVHSSDFDLAMQAERSIRDQQVLVRCLRSDLHRSMFVVIAGQMGVLHTTSNGAKTRLGTLSHGQAFGELHNVLGRARDCTVTCESDVVLAEFTRRDVAALTETVPWVHKGLEELCGWAEDALLRTDSAAFLTVDATEFVRDQVRGCVLCVHCWSVAGLVKLCACADDARRMTDSAALVSGR